MELPKTHPNPNPLFNSSSFWSRLLFYFTFLFTSTSIFSDLASWIIKEDFNSLSKGIHYALSAVLAFILILVNKKR